MIALPQNCIWSANGHPALLSLRVLQILSPILAKERGDLLSFSLQKCGYEILSSTCITQGQPHENERMTKVINTMHNTGMKKSFNRFKSDEGTCS